MRLKLGIGSKAKKLWSSSSLKGKTPNGENSAGQLEPNKNTSLGSKDETFFDSQTWLDSDCEDDFVSVHGDLIPSRGSTPNNHQINTNGPLQILDEISSSNTSPATKTQSPPTDGKRRRLAEFLKESQVEEQNDSNEQTKVNGKPGANDEAPKQDLNHRKERKMKAKQCCLPSLAHTFIFRERRSRKTHS